MSYLQGALHIFKWSKPTGFYKQPCENSFVYCSTAAQKGTEYRVMGTNSAPDLRSSLSYSIDNGLQNIYYQHYSNLYFTSSCNSSLTPWVTFKNSISLQKVDNRPTSLTFPH